jgi:CheY-like chemotaxis protein
VDAALAERHAGLRPGDYVRLSVGDTGHGMDAATIGRIFEPFFTTKAPGEGTGLGLSVVHGIMQSHEGVVTVTSQPGQGTCFQLYFPACATEARDRADETAPVPRGRGERILFVDDEELLTGMGKGILERLGYRVTAHTTPHDALAAVRSDPGGYDLVITDLTMPGVTGVDLAREIMTLRPDLPVLLVTGHNGNLTAGQVQALGIRELLLKPLSLHGLALTARRVLDATKKG